VISFTWGYAFAVHAAFVVSLRQSGYTGDVAILTPRSRVPREVASLYDAWRAQLIDTPIPRGRPSTERFVACATVCMRYRRCLVADFRDTLFQTNPFASLPFPGAYHPLRGTAHLPDLTVPLEPWTIGACDLNVSCINSMATRKCFGMRTLHALANASIGCSGVLLGTPRGFAALAAVITNASAHCPPSVSGMADQATLNYLIHTNRTTPTLRPSRDRRVPTAAARLAASLAAQPTLIVREQSARRRLVGSNPALSFSLRLLQPKRGPLLPREPRLDSPPLSSPPLSSPPRVPLHTSLGDTPAAAHIIIASQGGRLVSVALERQGAGVVNTLGIATRRPADAATFRRRHVSRDGLVHNDDGRLSAVVHQYDRLLVASGMLPSPPPSRAVLASPPPPPLPPPPSHARARRQQRLADEEFAGRYRLRLRAVDDAVRSGWESIGINASQAPDGSFFSDAWMRTRWGWRR